MKIGTNSGIISKVTLALGAIAGFLFGGWSELLTAILILHLLDIITALLAEGRGGKINSNKLGLEIKKKAGYWITLILANVIDVVLFDKQGIATTAVAFAFISTEGLSLVENLGRLGVPLPDFITGYLEQVGEKADVSGIELGDVPSKPVEKVVAEHEEGEEQILHKDEDSKEIGENNDL